MPGYNFILLHVKIAGVASSDIQILVDTNTGDLLLIDQTGQRR